jgi:tellurite resistance protein
MAAITRQDLRTILRFGIHIARVDNEFVTLEKKMLERIADSIGLTPQERQEIIQGEASLAEGLKRLSSHAARDLLVKTLCAVSHADGKATPEELEFINKVIEKLGESVFVYPREEWGRYEKEVIDILTKVKQE